MDYATYLRIRDMVTPMLLDTSHIAEIVAYIKGKYKEDDDYMMNILCIATIYDMYCPGSLFASAIAKMQVGVRNCVAEVMEYRNPEMVNYYHSRAIPFLKFREKGFGQKVEQIKNAFKHLSVRKSDCELGL